MDLAKAMAAVNGAVSGASSVASVSVAEVEAENARLKAQIAALRTAQRGGARLSLKVSEKGAVSVYGLGRFPVTLYQEQWTKLLDMAEEIRAFIGANKGSLKVKGE